MLGFRKTQTWAAEQGLALEGEWGTRNSPTIHKLQSFCNPVKTRERRSTLDSDRIIFKKLLLILFLYVNTS